MKDNPNDNLVVLTHPVLQDKLASLLDASTPAPAFRDRVREISILLAYEALRDLNINISNVVTPTGRTTATKIVNSPVIVSIMRAGNGMVGAINSVVPMAMTGHIGIYRDKSIEGTVEYFLRLPEDLSERTVLLVDPIIGTGETAVASIQRLKKFGVEEIRFLTILASGQGVAHILKAHPDVQVFSLRATADLNADGQLVPGLGDVAARFYNTN